MSLGVLGWFWVQWGGVHLGRVRLGVGRGSVPSWTTPWHHESQEESNGPTLRTKGTEARSNAQQIETLKPWTLGRGGGRLQPWLNSESSSESMRKHEQAQAATVSAVGTWISTNLLHPRCLADFSILVAANLAHAAAGIKNHRHSLWRGPHDKVHLRRNLTLQPKSADTMDVRSNLGPEHSSMHNNPRSSEPQ